MKQFTVTALGETKKYPEGTTFETIAKDFQDAYNGKILLAFVNGKLRELFHSLHEDAEISFATIADDVGASTYLRSLIFLMSKAVYDIDKEAYRNLRVLCMVGNGLYCHMQGKKLTAAFVRKIEKRMRELAEEDIPVMKDIINRDRAMEYFHKDGLEEKVKIFRYRRSSQTNIYHIGDCYNYFYSYLVPRTGYLKVFDLIPYSGGMILQRPTSDFPEGIRPYIPQKQLFSILLNTYKFGEQIGIFSVGDLNDAIVNQEGNNLVLTQEAVMEKTIGDVAEKIVKSGRKVVLIAGPSSSGKTSFANRLAVQLRAFGIHVEPLSCDDYFKDRSEYPVGEDGLVDFESLECVRVDDLNRDLNDLLRGKTVAIPTYNFLTGKTEYNGRTMRLGDHDVVLMEGIHCLNDALTPGIAGEDKFRIYISALTQLNIDEHNYIPTSDGRLIRRIVRDYRSRGVDAETTIRQWKSVRAGEEKNIFPYEENADETVNTALIYELALLKSYAEPLLFRVPENSPAYTEAKRLLKFLDYFLALPPEIIPKNSILREFIGGSVFPV